MLKNVKNKSIGGKNDLNQLRCNVEVKTLLVASHMDKVDVTLPYIYRALEYCRSGVFDPTY